MNQVNSEPRETVGKWAITHGLSTETFRPDVRARQRAFKRLAERYPGVFQRFLDEEFERVRKEMGLA